MRRFRPGDRFYSAANRVFRSPDRGLSWTVISPDLTESPSRDDMEIMGVKNTEIRFSRNDGISAWPTIVSLAESTKRPGLIYAGTDDGLLQITEDAGKNWRKVEDFPNLKRWYGRMKGLKQWNKVHEVFYGYAGSMKDVQFEVV